jgi:hypothetical protein
MDLSRVHKKLDEAQFFLAKMMEEEPRIVGGKQPFDYYLSAFLNAGRTIDYRLRYEQAAIYPAWRKGWDTSLTPQENSLIKFMVDDRIAEVHASGSKRSIGQEEIGLGIGEHRLPGQGMISISGPPDMPPVVMSRPTYKYENFIIAGAEWRVTDACTKYLALLQRMVAEFEAANP